MAQTATPKKKVVRPRKTAISTTDEGVNLHVYIPDPSIADRYVNRRVWGVWDATLAQIAHFEGHNILLEGDTGSGKTIFSEAYASKFQLPYYSLPCDVSMDSSAFFGKMQPTSVAGKFRWQDGPATQIFRYGGVLNLSEVNFMTPKIAASTFPMLDRRRYIPLLGHEGEVVRAHMGGGRGKCWCDLPRATCNKRRVLITADMNPNYRGTIELNAAFKNRFKFKVPWGYDETVEEALVALPTLRSVAKKLRDSNDVVTPVSTNMLMEFEAITNHSDLGLNFAINNFMSAFDVSERQPITNVFDMNKVNLEKDIRFLKRNRSRKPAPENEEELEEIEFVQEES